MLNFSLASSVLGLVVDGVSAGWAFVVHPWYAERHPLSLGERVTNRDLLLLVSN